MGIQFFYTVVELVPRCLGDDGLVHIDIHWRLLLAIPVAWLLLDFRYRWGDSEMTVRVMAITLSHPCDRDTPTSVSASFPNRLSDIGNPVFYTVVELVPRCLGDDGLVHTFIHVAVALSHPCDRDTPSSMKASFPNRLSDIGNPVFLHCCRTGSPMSRG